MSLRWSSYVAPTSPKGDSKTQNSCFPSKIALRLKKVSLCENCQRQSCKAFIGLTVHVKIIGGDDPFYLKFWVKVAALEWNRRFSIYFRYSASAVTCSEKIQLTLMGSQLRAFQWAQDEHRTLSLSPQSQLVLITKRKLHTGFWLVLTSMTLNYLERRNSPYFAFFTEFDSFAGQLYHSGWR